MATHDVTYLDRRLREVIHLHSEGGGSLESWPERRVAILGIDGRGIVAVQQIQAVDLGLEGGDTGGAWVLDLFEAGYLFVSWSYSAAYKSEGA